MFHERQINDKIKINKLRERALRIVYNDIFTLFEECELKMKLLQYIIKIFNHWQSKRIKL